MNKTPLSPDEIRKKSAKIGFSRISWFRTRAFPQYLEAIKERTVYHGIKYNPYNKFLDAARRKKQYKTLIVLLLDVFVSADYDPEGYHISNTQRYLWQTIPGRVESLVQFLRENGYKAKLLNVPDRAAACMAGLGHVGKNCLFYAKALGSYVGIQTIGTDLELEAENPGSERIAHRVCETCNKCVEACPVNAIDPKGYRINPSKCISFVNRHELEPVKQYPDDYRKMKHWLYGCEICQNVCPLNVKPEHEKNVKIMPLNFYGMKVPNQPSVSKAFLQEHMHQIKLDEYKTYVKNLIDAD